MSWVYLVLITIGIVAMVPTVLQATDLHQRDAKQGFVAFVALVTGAVGLLLIQFDVPLVATLVAALALGLAAGFVHPELLNLIDPPPRKDDQQPPPRPPGAAAKSADEETGARSSTKTKATNPPPSRPDAEQAAVEADEHLDEHDLDDAEIDDDELDQDSSSEIDEEIERSS